MPEFDTPEKAYAEAERRIEHARRDGATVLNLSGMGLIALPESIEKLTQLQNLFVSHNRLNTLPESIGQLTKLEALFVTNNQLSALPESIGQLTQLRGLYAYTNQLSALPEGIGQLTQLRGLNVTNNQLNTLPESIGQLTKLHTLFVPNNQLSALPESIGQLTKLHTLFVPNNQLNSLPVALLRLAEAGTLRELYLHGNDALGLPPEILGPTWHETQNKTPADPHEILRYYFARQKTGRARALNEAKVLFIGEAEVGKSSLIAALKEGPGKRHFDKTRGIVREKWWPNGEKEGELRLNLWDFGGQEVYHATHTFFLTQRAVYVVVVDARANDGQNNVEYWLQMARSFGGDAPVLVVVNKCDQHGEGPDENLLRRKYGELKLEFIRTSCWTGEGLETLKAAILSRIGAMSEVRREMPVSWLQIKDELEQMTEETLGLSAYRSLCKKHGEPGKENQDLLLDLWHKLGTVLYFCRGDHDTAFADLGILNPAWVTKGVYAVLDDDALRKRFGLLTQNQLRTALSKADYQGGDSHFIEEMMRRFELLFDAPDHNPRTMLVPRLLDEKEPPLDWPQAGTIRFLYRYEVLPSGLLPRFIVRRHQDLSQNPGPWRHGCVLELSGCRVLVRADKEKKEVEINVSGASGQREALDKVRLTFDDLHGPFKDLPVEEFIPVPGHPNAPLLPYALLRDLEWNGIESHNAQSGKRGEIISVDVSAALGSVRTAARKEREQAQARIHIEKLIGGNDMSSKISIGGDASGPVIAGDVDIDGDGVVIGNNNQVQIQYLADNPAELKAEIEKLRALIEQARTAGADSDDCDMAADAVTTLAKVTEEPEKDGAKKEAKGAAAILKSAAEGFESYEKIGKAFQSILKIVGPALGLLLRTQLPF